MLNQYYKLKITLAKVKSATNCFIRKTYVLNNKIKHNYKLNILHDKILIRYHDINKKQKAH